MVADGDVICGHGAGDSLVDLGQEICKMGRNIHNLKGIWTLYF